MFISNVFLWFSGRALLPREAMVEELSNASALNRAVMRLYIQRVAGKFVTLFAFLFGVGFALQMGRADERGASIVPLYSRRLGGLAPGGRMALTNYLPQTVISLFIFYGYGLGMLTQLSALACLGLGLALFSAQVVASHLWLARFRFGPVEWVWRSLTYGKAQPMRRDPSPLQTAPAAV